MYHHRVFSLLILLLALATAYQTNYRKHQIWRLEDIIPDQVGGVKTVIDSSGIDVWASGPTWVDLRVPPNLLESLWEVFNSKGLKITVLIRDLQRMVNREQQELLKNKSNKIVIGQYNQLEDIDAYVRELASTYDWVTVEFIGTTVENRQLTVNKLAIPGAEPKPSVWIDCGVHAREWISQAVCVYGLDYLTKSYSVIDEVTQLLDTYDVFLMPVLNPDGYYYTWHNDRFWRKNRGPTPQTCHGVDLNRNFDDGNWGGEGTSDIPCNDMYMGPQGFSELESQAVKEFTLGLMDNNNLTAFFSIHSYGQMWMFPYGWTSEYPPDFDALYRVSEIGINAIKEVHSTPYIFGSIYNVLYPASGTSVDWAYSEGVVHSYLIELRDTGSFGFLLPELEILPCAEETWNGIIKAILSIQEVETDLENVEINEDYEVDDLSMTEYETDLDQQGEKSEQHINEEYMTEEEEKQQYINEEYMTEGNNMPGDEVENNRVELPGKSMDSQASADGFYISKEEEDEEEEKEDEEEDVDEDDEASSDDDD